MYDVLQYQLMANAAQWPHKLLRVGWEFVIIGVICYCSSNVMGILLLLNDSVQNCSLLLFLCFQPGQPFLPFHKRDDEAYRDGWLIWYSVSC